MKCGTCRSHHYNYKHIQSLTFHHYCSITQKKKEQEKREKKKLKEKERKERLRAEGKLLTDKQKQDKRRAQEMLEAMKAQGLYTKMMHHLTVKIKGVRD